MKTLPHPTHPAFSLPVAGFVSHWLAALRTRLRRRPDDDYPLTPAALADMGLSEADLMAIRSGRFEGDATRRGR